MDFDIGEYCSIGLRGILDRKGLVERPSFSLQIKKRPVFRYLDYLQEKYGLKLVREFHIGCSWDSRPPNIRYTARRNEWDGEMVFWSEQRLTQIVSLRNGYFHDEKGKRDLLAVSKAMNDQENIEQRIVVGWSGSAQALGLSEYNLGRSGYFRIIVQKNRWKHVDGLDDFIEHPFGTKEVEKAVLGRIVEGTDSPFARPEIREAIKEYQFMDAKEFSAVTGMLLADAVGEATKIFWPQLRKETAEEKVFRDQTFGGMRM
ncbi:MAG: hypothetical protein V1887_03615 [Candidatus Aenigmatarchaeota archaeon]